MFSGGWGMMGSSCLCHLIRSTSPDPNNASHLLRLPPASMLNLRICTEQQITMYDGLLIATYQCNVHPATRVEMPHAMLCFASCKTWQLCIPFWHLAIIWHSIMSRPRSTAACGKGPQSLLSRRLQVLDVAERHARPCNTQSILHYCMQMGWLLSK